MRSNAISDTQILIIGYNRPELIAKRLVNASSLRGQDIRLSIDFYNERTTHLMKEVVSMHQKSIQEFNKLEVVFHETNLGLAKHVTSAISEVLNSYEKVIVIEDDIEFNSHSIASLEFGLSIMERDSSIASAGMFSPLNFSSRITQLNFFRYSRYFSCWGWCTTRKIWSKYRLDISQTDPQLDLSHSKMFNTMPKKNQTTWIGRFNKLKSNTFHTWDLQFQLMAFQDELKHLVPFRTIANNEGFNDSRSAHTKGRQPFWMRDYPLVAATISKVYESRAINRVMELIESYSVIGDGHNPRLLNNLKAILRRKSH